MLKHVRIDDMGPMTGKWVPAVIAAAPRCGCFPQAEML
jgi:hypothetical protein